LVVVGVFLFFWVLQVLWVVLGRSAVFGRVLRFWVC